MNVMVSIVEDGTHIKLLCDWCGQDLFLFEILLFASIGYKTYDDDVIRAGNHFG